MPDSLNFDIYKIREDFPILNTLIHGKALVYFDNGATSQKPKVVIDKINELYKKKNSSIHRGIHHLSELMTSEYEEARNIVKEFINASDSNEIIFTSGTTASINTLAFSFGERFVVEGDEILISEMEHHSNIVPWQMLCDRKKAKLRIIPFDDNGELILHDLRSRFNEKTSLLALTHVSNSLGTINPVKEIIKIAHEYNVPVMLDGAQAVQHGKIDVKDLDCDFYAFSGHKIFGPTGIGVLYGKEKYLDELPPYQGGGDMVECVKFEKTTYNILPFKFEAGTSNYIDAIALGSALKYVRSLGIENIVRHESSLLDYLTKKMQEIEGITIYGKAKNKVSILSFLPDNIHPMDMGMLIDKMGIAVRTGTHCTQPVMDHFNINGTMRASLAFYNTIEEIDIFIDAVKKAQSMLY